MSTPEYVARLRRRPEVLVKDFPRPEAKWVDWATTTDHKKIGLLYFFAVGFFFVIGGVEALLMRLQLGTPNNTLIDPAVYSELFSLHGTTMLFLVTVPVVAAFANYLVPLMIGARNVAFPRLAMLAWWLLIMGGVVLYASLFWTSPEAGWTSYSTLSEREFLPTNGIDAWVLALELVALSTILSSISLIATIKNMRAPGMAWARVPLFAWSVLVYSYVVLIAFGSFAATALMLLIDRNFSGGFFNANEGGSPLLWQHLFWFMGHPVMYCTALPVFGIVSEIVAVFSRKPIFGYRAIKIAIAAIGFLSLVAWGQHMFTSPLAVGVLSFFMVTGLLVAIPLAIQIFNWIATLWRGNITISVPLLFCVGLIAQLAIGCVSGLLLASFPLSWQLQDSQFWVAHMHTVLVGGVLFGVLAGLYYWYPKMSGRFMSDTLGKASFWLMLIGSNVTFLPLYSAGLSGMPERIVRYADGAGLHGYNLVSTIGAFLLAAGVLVTVANALRSVRKGRPAPPDPWNGNTLEWFTTSPPPEHDFDLVPIVRSAEPMKDFRKRAKQLEGEQRAEVTVSEPVV